MGKKKIESAPESVIQIKQPMVRDFSTGGGHLPGDTLVEGDDKIVTRKWQGYPPENLNVVGKPMPAMPEVAIPRYTGRALYATRVLLPNLLYVKLLTCPHPHARIKSLDNSKAERMPGVAYILTYKNAPKTFPLSQELNFQGDTVAFVAAETEDLAEDAVAAIEVDYEILPFASTLVQAAATDAPDLHVRRGKGNLILLPENDPHQRAAPADAGGPTGSTFGAEVELNADGYVIMKNALPDSGTNHDTGLAQVVAEILGFTTRDRMRVVWGDSDLAPSSNTWYGGRTITLQGAAVFSAADKLRKELLRQAAADLKADVAKLVIKDGAISSTEDPKKRTTFAALAKANGGSIRTTGAGVAQGQGRALTKGAAACFVEVEVDTWTADWRVTRSVYCHDAGLVINPLVAEADLHGSLVECVQMTTDPVPWDREFPGTTHYSVGYLSFRLPTIMDVPQDQTNIFVDSLEPRWFYGIKSFSETGIGSVPGAISNALYNAVGVRIRDHAITREKIMAGLRAKGLGL